MYIVIYQYGKKAIFLNIDNNNIEKKTKMNNVRRCVKIKNCFRQGTKKR